MFDSFWQAMWAWVVSLPVTLANFSPARAVPMGVGGWACFGIAAAGLAVETVADYQAWVCLCLNSLLDFANVHYSWTPCANLAAVYSW